MINKIPIRPKPLLIVITYFENNQYQYWLNDRSTINKRVDVGVWNIKYKLC